MSGHRVQSALERPDFDDWISRYSSYNGEGPPVSSAPLDPKSRRRSSVQRPDDMRRQSLANSFHTPSRNLQHHNSPHHENSNPNPISNGNIRKWSNKYRNSGNFDFDPLGAPKKSLIPNTRSSSITSSKSGSTTANDQDSRGSAGSNPHALLSSPRQTEQEKEMIREAGQLASVFLDMRKNITSDYNIDLEHNESLDMERDRNIPGQVRLKNISRATIQRSEKVKAMFNLYYFYLFNSQKATNTKYEGVDGKFNPLQVIRNRRIRKKYHQPPKLAIKTLPYASSVFSRSKNKLIWQVDLTELTYDFNWRAQHWHELVNPHGELWFPEMSSKNRHKHHHHKNHRHSHRPHLHRHHSSEKEVSYIHDKLFEFEDDEDDDIEKDYEEDEWNGSSSKEDLSESRARKRDRLASKIRKRSKSPFKRTYQHKEQLDPAIQLDKDSNLDSSFLNLPSPPEDNSNNGSSYKRSLLNDISIEPVKAQRVVSSSSQFNNIDGELNGNEQQLANTPSRDMEAESIKNLNLYLQKLRRLDDLMSFGEHHLSVKDREYASLLNLDNVLKDSELIRQDANFLKSNVLMKYETLVNEKTETLENYQNELSNNYSPRVDKLLLLSDRTIGEVNTTLSLEVRKLSERLEKLGPSHKRTGSLVNLAYWLLENLIVLLLWTVWIGFSIGRVIRFFVVLIWKVLKWIFY